MKIDDYTLGECVELHMLYLNIKLKNPLKKKSFWLLTWPVFAHVIYLQESQPETILIPYYIIIIIYNVIIVTTKYNNMSFRFDASNTEYFPLVRHAKFQDKCLVLYCVLYHNIIRVYTQEGSKQMYQNTNTDRTQFFVVLGAALLGVIIQLGER